MQKKIDEILAKQKNNFSQDTDEEIIEVKSSDEITKKLPEFLDLKTFFIDEYLDEDVVKILERYIIAYKG